MASDLAECAGAWKKGLLRRPAGEFNRELAMAKGQKRSNREPKKPKQPKSAKKAGMGATAIAPASANPLITKRRP